LYGYVFEAIGSSLMPSLSPNIYFVTKTTKNQKFSVFVFVCKCCVWRLFY